MLIFSVPKVYELKTQHKLIARIVNTVQPMVPTFHRLLEREITFDMPDHPDHILELRRYLLVVDPFVANFRMTKVPMDNGNSLNILY